MFTHITSKPLDLDQMRMGQIRNNSVVKKILTEKIFSGKFSVALIDSILTIFIITIENTKQLKNEMGQKDRCKISDINVENTA